jgi:cytochrome c oxidase subunit II
LRKLFPALVLSTSVAGCTGELSTLSPAGPVAASVARLWWVMAAGAIVLFLLVMTLFLMTLFRPGFGRSITPTTWIAAGGLMLPIPVLVVLLAYAFAQGERLLLAGGAAGNPARIEARARMWQWEFFYLDHHSAPSTLDVLHIPAGVPVEIIATSEDVIHSFWVPRLAGKVDATPGHAARLRLLVDAPGMYRGACAEFCGSGHTSMFFTVHAHTPEHFQRLMSEQAATSGRGALQRLQP